jgi:hypothetical protein
MVDCLERFVSVIAINGCQLEKGLLVTLLHQQPAAFLVIIQALLIGCVVFQCADETQRLFCWLDLMVVLLRLLLSAWIFQ